MVSQKLEISVCRNIKFLSSDAKCGMTAKGHEDYPEHCLDGWTH